MKKLLLASVALVALAGASAASAADMPTKAPVYKVPPPVVAYGWTGFYVGVNGGYGWKDRTVDFIPNDSLTQSLQAGFAGSAFPGSTSFDVRGAFAGFQLGYNWQFARNWLIGFETDFDWSGIRGAGSAPALIGVPFPVPLVAATVTAEQNLRWFGTVRGRLGLLPTNDLMVYGTGGFAYGRVTETASLVTSAVIAIGSGGFGFSCQAGADCFVGSSSRTAVGWTAGGGFEFALSGNVTVKGEYSFIHLGHGDSVNSAALNAFGAANPASFTAAYGDLNLHTVRVGLNYRFADSAVVAKY